MTDKEEKMTCQSITDYFKFQEREIIKLRRRVQYMTNQLEASHKQNAALRQRLNPAKSYLQLSINDLGFSTSMLNCLKGGGFSCVADLVNKTEAEMLRMAPGFGRKRLNVLIQTLESMGLRLGMDNTDL